MRENSRKGKNWGRKMKNVQGQILVGSPICQAARCTAGGWATPLLLTTQTERGPLNSVKHEEISWGKNKLIYPQENNLLKC